MDTKKRLQQAEDIKQKGNEFFQKKLYKEAECQYNQVLEHLPPVANLTGEVKERRDNLAVAAHLNLALCQLRLSGNSTNINEHCDEALKINQKSVKAYYRRAQAQRMDQGYQLAIKDYQQVLVLEPSNMAAQTQLQLCRTLLQRQEPQLPSQLSPTDVSCKTVTAQHSGTDEQPDIADRLSLTEDDDQTEYHEMEVGVECEADCFQRQSKCHKAANHDKFIALAVFTPKHLPPPFQGNQELYELILLQAKLAVLLMVMGRSDKRPKTHPNNSKMPYAFSNDSYRSTPRVGSGHVSLINPHTLEENVVCPCESCQNSGTPAKQWGEITICTATHVVFDEFEGQNTKCYLFYDSDQMSVWKCPILRAAVKVKSDIHTDISNVTFISHDLGLVEQLDEAHFNYTYQLLHIRSKYTHFGIYDPKTYDEVLQQLSLQQARLDRCAQLYGELIKKMKAYGDNITPQWLDDYSTWLQNNGYPDGDLLSKLLVDKLKGGHEYENQLGILSEAFDKVTESVKRINQIITEISPCPLYDKSELTRKALFNSYHATCDWEEKANMRLKYYMGKLHDKREVITTDVPCAEKPDYDPTRPLVVIVSHPHGLGKKISLGEVKSREEVKEDEMFGATTPPDTKLMKYFGHGVTCPGSSGAHVYVMGKRMVFNDQPHRGTVLHNTK